MNLDSYILMIKLRQQYLVSMVLSQLGTQSLEKLMSLKSSLEMMKNHTREDMYANILDISYMISIPKNGSQET